MKLGMTRDVKLSVQIAPLIDVVFLLLIYFMVTAALVKKEGDISFKLPVPDRQAQLDFPVEALISIAADGEVSLDGIQFDKSDRKLDGLAARIMELKLMAEAQNSIFFVTLDPDDHTIHERIVDVLDACASSQVRNLSFARHDV